MRRFDASFPHPILGINDDIVGEYSASGNVQVGDEVCTVKLMLHTDNPYFQKLLKAREASFVIEVHCQETTFREFYKGENLNEELVVTIRTELIKGLVEVYYYICANGHLLFSSDTFNKDYDGYDFEVGDGDIIGYKGKTYFFVDKYDPTLSKAGSIMTITRKEDDDKTVTYDFDNDKIVIYLPGKYHDFLRNTMKVYGGVYQTTLAYPAIIGALKKYTSDYDGVRDRKWAIAIRQRAERDDELGSLLNYSGEQDLEMYMKAAQKIIGFPVSKTFKNLEELDNKFSMKDDEYES